MNSHIKLYGFIVSGVKGEGGYEFEVGDIYLKQRTKSLKADSPDFPKLSSNIDFLKTAKNFVFYTKSENGSRYTALGVRFLKDFVENQSSGRRTFNLKIIAVIGGNSVIANFSGCELVQSMMMPTPIGTVQSYEIRFNDATVEK